MSAFSDWKATVYFQKPPNDEQLKVAFYAGMVWAESIADELHILDEFDNKRACTNQDAAKAIRKEIE